jgi:hypothetical protein
MIVGFSFDYNSGTPSSTHTTDAYLDGMSPELVAIGHAMAMDDYLAHGSMPRGYDHVRVTER